MNLGAIDSWHKTKVGHLTFGLAELLFAYIFASLAIDSGSLIEYAAALILIAGALQNIVKVFIPSKNERKRR
jgi:hypothetical protein